jgi:hypothetical protein
MLAALTFWDTQRGGRQRPPLNGFRPHLKVGDEFTSCKIESIDGVEVFEFEQEFNVQLTLMFPELYSDTFHVGDAVNFYEGSRQIASGTIVAKHS